MINVPGRREAGGPLPSTTWPPQGPTMEQLPTHDNPPDRTFSWIPGASARVDVINPTDTPWRSIALLNFFRGRRLASIATGFLVAPDVLLTAAHAVTGSRPYDALGVWMAIDARHQPDVQPIPVIAFALDAGLDIAIFVLGAPSPDCLSLSQCQAGSRCSPCLGRVWAALSGYDDPLQLRVRIA